MPTLSTLLVIDHDKHALDRMAFGFEREGMLVARTTAVEEAGAIVRDRKPQVIVAGLPADSAAAAELIRKLRSNGTAGVPMIAIGALEGAGGALRAEALRAGASEFLPRPAFIRDLVTAARVVTGTQGETFRAILRDVSVASLLRSLEATRRSGVLSIERPGTGGARRGDVQFSDGEAVWAQIGEVGGMPALQRMLLWSDGAVELRFQSIMKPGKTLGAGPRQVLEEVAEYMRQVIELMSNLGSSDEVWSQDTRRVGEVQAQIPKEVAPVIRLFDGRRTLADVTDESPFRPRDTLRVASKLRGMGILRREGDKKRRAGSTPGGGTQAAAPPAVGPVPTPGEWVGMSTSGPAPTTKEVESVAAALPAGPSVSGLASGVVSGEIGQRPAPAPPAADSGVRRTPAQGSVAAAPTPPKPTENPWIALAGNKPSMAPHFAPVVQSAGVTGEIKSVGAAAEAKPAVPSVIAESAETHAPAPPRQASIAPEDGALQRSLEAALERTAQATQAATAPQPLTVGAAHSAPAPEPPRREGLEAVLDAGQRGRLFAPEAAPPLAPGEGGKIEVNLAAVSRALASPSTDDRTIPVEKLSLEELASPVPVAIPVPAPPAPAISPAAPAPPLPPPPHHPQAHAPIVAKAPTPQQPIPAATPAPPIPAATPAPPEPKPAPPPAVPVAAAPPAPAPAPPPPAPALPPAAPPPHHPGERFSQMEEDFFADSDKHLHQEHTESFEDLDDGHHAPKPSGWSRLWGLFGGKRPTAPPRPTRTGSGSMNKPPHRHPTPARPMSAVRRQPTPGLGTRAHGPTPARGARAHGPTPPKGHVAHPAGQPPQQPPPAAAAPPPDKPPGQESPQPDPNKPKPYNKQKPPRGRNRR